ncbi:MAG: hypothetical protein LBE04_00860 [Prevotellaceae bacterium]|jgi:hypothetical protein|nr:hypothetical protein [Prevotellaceae bacterium]
MTDRQQAKLNMYQKVTKVFDENTGEYAGVPAVVTAVNDLKGQVSGIVTAAKQQTGTKPQGATKDKSEAFDRMVVVSLKIANPLYALAFEAGDNRLLKKVAINKNDFYNVHAQKALSLAQNIADEAGAHSVRLHDYGISDANRIELDDAIAKATDLKLAPAGLIAERQNYTGNLRQLFVAADSIIYDRLDKMMMPFKTSSPEFYAMYSNARNVVNTAARKRKDNTETAE